MSDKPDIVAQMRVLLIENLRPAGPEATQEVLDALATVIHDGDDDVYLVEATHIVSLAAPRAIQKRIDALHAEIASNNAKADALEAQITIAHLAVEQFRRMKTPKTIQ